MSVMAPPEVQQQRSNFFDAYAAGHNPTSSGAANNANNATRTASAMPTIPRKHLMHALRRCGLCPTAQELADAEADVLNRKDTLVTRDQFLEICDTVRSLDGDVASGEILAAFKSVTIDPTKSAHHNNHNHNNNNNGQSSAASTSSMGASRTVDNNSPNGAQQHGQSGTTTPLIVKSPTTSSEEGIVTRAEMRQLLNLMTDEQFEAAMEWLDPKRTNQINLAKVSELLAGGGATGGEKDEGAHGRQQPSAEGPATTPAKKSTTAPKAEVAPAMTTNGDSNASNTTTNESNKNKKDTTTAAKDASIAAPAKSEPKSSPKEAKAQGACCVIQ